MYRVSHFVYNGAIGKSVYPDVYMFFSFSLEWYSENNTGNLVQRKPINCFIELITLKCAFSLYEIFGIDFGVAHKRKRDDLKHQPQYLF